METLNKFWVVYDDSCGLCTEVKAWILRQTPAVAIEFVAAGSDEARGRFGSIPAGELAVVGNTGEVWLGNSSWIICLWALRDYRELSVRLSSPLLITMARQAFTAVSKNRAALSRLMGLKSERQIEIQLKEVSAPSCVVSPG